MTSALVVAIITAVITSILGYLTGFQINRSQSAKNEADGDKSAAEAAETVTNIALKLLTPLNERLAQLEACNEEMSRKVTGLEDVVRKQDTRIQTFKEENAQQMVSIATLASKIEQLSAENILLREHNTSLSDRLAVYEKDSRH